MHGYDVIAHDQINPELGGAAGFERFSKALQSLGMNQILDLVPNHMGVLAANNPWWNDVLEHGTASSHARTFDIDWSPVNQDLVGKVLVPVLGEHYGDALATGLLQVVFVATSGCFELHYREHRFPLDPRTIGPPLARAAQALDDRVVSDALAQIAEGFDQLPARPAPPAQIDLTRAERGNALKRRLAVMAGESAALKTSIDAAVNQINTATDRDDLHALHEAQAYRLAYWSMAADEINYRRFFDVNALAALRMEEPSVFEASHALTLDLCATGQVDGLRIDHPDGLFDPAQYFERLQQGYRQRIGAGPERSLYVLAEKIAAPHEDVPEDWQIHGTTGYRFAMVAGGVLVDTSAEAAMTQAWQDFSGENRSFDELAHIGRRWAARTALASELTVHATALRRIARADRRTRDHSFNSLRDALAEVAASMPVYRSYVIDQPSKQDLQFIDWAIAHARRQSMAADDSVFEFVRRCLVNETLPGQSPALAGAINEFAIRFQQYCAPVAAKGVEDTAFYRDHRLISLNEVGGDPGVFGLSLRAFHGASADRAERWPNTVLATSTHDNKRAEDVRNRISVLSEMPADWAQWLARWSELSAGWHVEVDGETAPSRSDEYLLHQTVLGSLPMNGLDDTTLPAYRERIQAYMLKAVREAKVKTGWVRPNEAYEQALAGFIDKLLGRLHPNPLLVELRANAAMLAHNGALNSLTMVLLKYTSPGMPDLYQGTELIDLSLVDPDNRRPVDYALRERLLGEVSDATAVPSAWTNDLHDGRLKLWLTWRLLQVRASLPALFEQGDYHALSTTGVQAEHVIGYSRSTNDATLYVVASRFFVGLTNGESRWPVGAQLWRDTSLALPGVADGERLVNLLTDESVGVRDGAVNLAEVFSSMPFAVLQKRLAE
jgi:(1->4)-alpha-D-glucan 1-alpha-D-glucosylmutase